MTTGPLNGDGSDAESIRLVVVDPRSGEAIAAMSAYFAELDDRFPDGFDPGDTLQADAAQFDPPSGAFVVVRERIGGDGTDGVPDRTVGCGGVLTLGPGVAEIKRMWIAPDVRGRGLAVRLLAELEAHARRIGHSRVRLDTNATLTAAIALYERSGYRPIERYNRNPYAQCWFEKSLDR